MSKKLRHLQFDDIFRQNTMSERFFVLTYVDDHDKVEHWIRLSAAEIVECVDDSFMSEGDEIDFAIHEFDEKESIDILRDIDFMNAAKMKKGAIKIDQEYPTMMKNLPDEINICKPCYVFTTSKKCKFCDGETSDIEL